MAEQLIIQGETKQERYEALLPQIKAVIEDESDLIANMANVAAMLHETFGFWWTGFYRVVGEELVLGPFQGPMACTRIKKGRGVCGTAWQQEETQVVPDVDKFPGHIACSSLSLTFSRDLRSLSLMGVVFPSLISSRISTITASGSFTPP